VGSNEWDRRLVLSSKNHKGRFQVGVGVRKGFSGESTLGQGIKGEKVARMWKLFKQKDESSWLTRGIRFNRFYKGRKEI